MPANINSHVVRLHRFLPFSAAHDQIYEEYQTGEDNLDLETVALKYTATAIKAGAQCIVLTGDAGHGKTHMCRRLLEDSLLGYQPDIARQYLLDKCDGGEAISPAGNHAGARLRIHKDLSEMQPPSKAAGLLEASATRTGETLVVCANEGRLRAITSSDAAGAVCRKIGELFHASFQNGITADQSGMVHIVNLNYQSVAAASAHSSGSLLSRVMDSWVGDGRRWTEKSCGTCDHMENCPIRRNRALLAEHGEVSQTRLRRLEEMFEVIERLGYVVTIREMLMLVAYLLTGGLSCRDVDLKVTTGNGRRGWQHKWAYYNLLFGSPPGLPPDRVEKGIPVLAALRRLDPGAIAIRRVDEKILNRGDVFEPDQLDLQFEIAIGGKRTVVDAAFGIDDFNGNPQSRADLNREVEATRFAVSSLRRRAFFDEAHGEGSVMQRLGFRHGDVFLKLMLGNLSSRDSVEIKNLIIAGLHVIQGLRIGHSAATLYLVDPAFGKANANAAIVSRLLPGSDVNMQAASMAWLSSPETRWILPKSVDWIDRAVVLQILERQGETCDLPLDLLSFECVARAASGYVSDEFYANEIRRVRTFLGQLAERGRSSVESITVFMDGKPHNVSLDMGVIQVGVQ